MTPGGISVEQRQHLAPWWLVLLQGIAAILIGLMLVTSPAATTVAIIQFLGWYWLIGGIFEIVGIFLDTSQWGWKLAGGILGILAGLAIINHPLWATVLSGAAAIWVMASFGIAMGFSMLAQAFRGGGLGKGVLGMLSILLGVLLLLRPVATAVALAWVFGVIAIAGGIAAVIMAFRLR